MTRNAVRIDPQDTVAVAIEELSAGTPVKIDDANLSVVTTQKVPRFHKVALKDMQVGEPILKYGSYIGEATSNIKAGDWVSTHNLASTDATRARDFDALNRNAPNQSKHDFNAPDQSTSSSAAPDQSTSSSAAPDQSTPNSTALKQSAPSPIASMSQNKEGAAADSAAATFMGYERPDGRIGVRNYVLVLPTSVCASDLAAQVARDMPGAVSFHNQNGCSQVPADQDITLSALAGFAANPNVYGTVALSLGCEGCQNDIVCDLIEQRTNKPLRKVIIQQAGGIEAARELATQAARELASQAAQQKRPPQPVSKLILGTNCGGSDTTSGLGANPLIGRVSDWLVAKGGTSVLCETSEFFGGEQLLAARARTPEVGEEILRIVREYEDYVHMFGAQMREGNPSPGNIAGGLSTLEEKSLGCIHKGGHAPIEAVYPYAAQLKAGEGLVIMDTPGNDPSSVAGLIAGGCQVVLFSTGLGTATGNALAPVLRLTANPNTVATMHDAIDFDASQTIFGPSTNAQISATLIEKLIAVCDGEKTCAEKLGFCETALPHLCNYM